MSEYVGSELELFAQARQWKCYWASRVRHYTSGHVLDVGAGIGASLDILASPAILSWHALEPDGSLAAQIPNQYDFPVDVTVGTCADISETRYDSILYVDVLEHIDNDRQELEQAADLLTPGGFLVVLAPAHHYLYSAFDKAIGHYRRYDRKMLTGLTPAGLSLNRIEYLDSIGMLASLANRVFLRQSAPTMGQIQTWDRLMVPCSRIMDTVTLHRLGKTILGVWQKTE